MNIKSTLIFFLSILFLLPTVSCTRKKEIGNVIRVGIREKIRSMDPVNAADYYSTIEIRRAYEGLVQFHYLKRPYSVEPHLAESMPTVSKDGLTYTFKIKKGVLFHNDKAFPNGKGRELTAEDFVYSFKRLADSKLASDGWWILDGKIKGLNEWREKNKNLPAANYDEAVEGLRAPDRYTLVLTLKQKYPLLLQNLTMQYASVVAREAVEFYKGEFINHPVGTGPFVMTYKNANQIIWERNPNYRDEYYPSEGTPEDKAEGRLADAGQKIPFIDKIIDDVIIEDQPAWLNFMQGNHDLMLKVTKDSMNTIFGSDHKPTQKIRDMGVQVFVEPGLWFNYYGFNWEDPVVGGEKNLYLRKAMALAYDEGPAIEKFFQGIAIKAESPVMPGVFGYDPKYKNPWREYNLAKAREILAKAGHPGGEGIPELVLDTRSDPTARLQDEYFQRQMAELGLKVRINSSSWPELINRIRKKQIQMFAMSWIYDYPDAENGLQLLYSKNESPGSNEANFKNKTYDVLYEKMAVEPNNKTRLDLIAKMRKIFEEQIPWLITFNRSETRLAHSWVKNFKINNFELNAEKYLRIDLKGREISLKQGVLAVGK